MTMFPPSPEQVTETLTRLDWSPTCEAPDCGTTADMFLRLIPCQCTGLVCVEHARAFRRALDTRANTCTRCSAHVFDARPHPIPGEDRT